MARLCPLFSGSTGNSYYIGSRSAGLLIDGGRSAKQLGEMLGACGIPLTALKGILITHEHSDHISGVRVFAKKHRLPVFASLGTLRAMAPLMEGVELRGLEPGLVLAGMEVESFPISHDSVEPVGYRIRTEDDRVLAFCTDVGFAPPEVVDRLLGADFVVLESNHDVSMVKNGYYPFHLKQRILSPQGHLSNGDCAKLLPQLVAAGTRRFLLAHLSHENNTPSVALDTALQALLSAGLTRDVDFTVEVARSENREKKVLVF